MMHRPHSGEPGYQRKSGKQVHIDFWLAGVPLLAALASVLTKANHIPTLRTLVTILFIASAALLFKHVKPSLQTHRLGRLMVLLGFVVWYALPGFLALWSSPERFDENMPIAIQEETIALSVFYLALFLFVWLVVSRLFERPPQLDAKVRSAKLMKPSSLVVIALLACAVGFVPFLSSGLSIVEVVGRIGASRAAFSDKPWIHVDQLGNEASSLLYLASSMRTAAAILLLVAALDRRVHKALRLVAAVVGVFTALLIAVDEATRSITAIMFLPLGVMLFLRLWVRSRRRATFVLVAGALLLFFVLQFQLLYRNSYNRDQISDQFFRNWATLGGTTDYFTETALAVELVPTYHDFFRESTLVQFVTSPIPRSLWDGKPVTRVVWFYTLIRWGIDIYSQQGNVFPGIVGQYYMSWGWLGPILLGIIFGIASSKCDGFLSRVSLTEDPYSFVVGVMFAVWLLVTFRYLSPGFLYPVIGAAGIVVLSRLAPPKTLWDEKTLPDVTRYTTGADR